MVTPIRFRARLPITAALLLLSFVTSWGQKCSDGFGESGSADKAADWRVIRSFEDAGTHQSWQVMRDPRCPAAPARLVGPTILHGGRASMEESRDVRLQTALRLLIHAGDSLIVEEHTTLVNARLEATALSSAAQGEPLKIQLKIGDRIVRAVAVERGRAEILSPTREARP
jgi:hypothetical protein